MMGAAGMAGLLALIGSVWEWGRAFPRVDFTAPHIDDPVATISSPDLPRPSSDSVVWTAPAESDYDLFAPNAPESDGRPGIGIDSERGLPGLHLREIEPVPFRVQLAGHLGSGPELRGIISASDPPVQRLLASGDDWAEQAIKVQTLRVDGEDELGAIVEAEVLDRRAGRVLRLREGESAPGGNWRARVDIDSSADSRWLEPGESFGVEDEFWTLEAISPDPPEIRISRRDLTQTKLEYRRVPLSAAE